MPHLDWLQPDDNQYVLWVLLDRGSERDPSTMAYYIVTGDIRYDTVRRVTEERGGR